MRADAGDLDLSAGDGSRDEERPRLDAVAQHRVLGRVHLARRRVIRIVELPAPSISAPMLTRNLQRSTISGSRAAFSSVVVPSAITAAISRFSVAPTLG